jgi:hypothetical protein
LKWISASIKNIINVIKVITIKMTFIITIYNPEIIIPGTSSQGHHSRDIIPGTSFLGHHSWDIIPGTSFLGHHPRDIIPGMMIQ